jgi:RND family efflux transporter MFP subunit
MSLLRAFFVIGLAVSVLTAQDAVAQRKGGRGDDKPTSVIVDTVRVEPFAQTAPILGRLVSRQAGLVAARVAGPVVEMLVYVGDRVDVGQPIAKVDARTLRWTRAMRAAQLAEQNAVIKKAESELELAQQELMRLESLRQSAAFSEARFNDKRLEVDRYVSLLGEARAKQDFAQANLGMSDHDLESATIRAPYAGVVTRRYTDVGSYLKVGDPAISMIGDADLEIEADIPVGRLDALDLGTMVTTEMSSGVRTMAIVRAVIPDENPLARTQAVRFTPSEDSQGQRLAQNQSVTVLVPLGSARDVLTVHKDAVIQRNGERVVFVITNGQAMSRNVTLGRSVDGRFEVIDGLTDGDVAVVRGNERLKSGQKVAPRMDNPNGARSKVKVSGTPDLASPSAR